jgi:hypothetical protein
MRKIAVSLVRLVRPPLCCRPPLSRNALDGDIPALHALTALRDLDLSFNRFARLPPSSIGALGALAKLDISYNRIADNLAEAAYLGRLSSLANFDARRNLLWGAFPAWMRNVSATLVRFRIGLNQLRCDFFVFGESALCARPWAVGRISCALRQSRIGLIFPLVSLFHFLRTGVGHVSLAPQRPCARVDWRVSVARRSRRVDQRVFRYNSRVDWQSHGAGHDVARRQCKRERHAAGDHRAPRVRLSERGAIVQ